MPASSAAIRACVHSGRSSGGAEVAAATMASGQAGPWTSRRPLRGRSARAGMPPWANRCRQVRTVPCAQPSSAAIRAFGQPAWASSTIRFRRASACGADARRVIASSFALRRDPGSRCPCWLRVPYPSPFRWSAVTARQCPEHDLNWRRHACTGDTGHARAVPPPQGADRGDR